MKRDKDLSEIYLNEIANKAPEKIQDRDISKFQKPSQSAKWMDAYKEVSKNDGK
jgi:hypothetical protein